MPWVIILVFFIFIFLFLLWLFPIIEVCGDSMYPTLHDREHIIGMRVLKKKFHSGDIYVYHSPDSNKYVIKRLIHFNDKGLFFIGDNSEVSHDSRAYGFVSPKNVVAKVIFRKQVKA